MSPPSPSPKPKRSLTFSKTAASPTPRRRVPVTVLTGFLGSGKTTLLNHILRDRSHGLRFAVIENELGEIGVDEKILSENVDEEVVEIINGCICCRVRSDLVAALKRLHGKVATFDAVIIETTGLADPAPVVQTFFAETSGDESLESLYRLDSVIAVADARHIVDRLDEEKPEGTVNEAALQVCFADRIILNKTDLVPVEAGLAAVEARLRELNPHAPIVRCEYSRIPPRELLNVGAFDLDRVLASDPFFLGELKRPQHDQAVSSLSMRVDGEVDMKKLEDWIHHLLHDEGRNLYRYKGIISVRGMEEKFVFQGVGHFFDHAKGGKWGKGEKRESTLVFIGKDLPIQALRAGFEGCRETRDLHSRMMNMMLHNR